MFHMMCDRIRVYDRLHRQLLLNEKLITLTSIQRIEFHVIYSLIQHNFYVTKL